MTQYLFLLCFFLSLVPRNANSLELDQSLSIFQNLNSASLVCLDQQLPPSAAERCALDLCGPPVQNSSAHLTEFNYEQFILPNSMKEFSAVLAPLKKNIDAQLDSLKSFVKAATGKMESNDFNSFSGWEQKDFDTLANKIFNRFLSTTEDETVSASARFNVKVSQLPGQSPALKKALATYADRLQVNLNAAKDEQVSCNEVCKEGVKSYLNGLDFKKFLADLNTVASSPKIKNQTISTCKAMVAMASLKDGQEKEFGKYAAEAIDHFLKNTTKGYSGRSMNDLKTHLEDMIDLRHSTRSDSGAAMLEGLKATDFATVDHSSARTPDLINTFLEKMISETAVTSSLNICGGGTHLLTDSYTSKEMLGQTDARDTIDVSIFSSVHPKVGKLWFAHELGHALSTAFANGKLSPSSYKAFKKLRSCATSLYKNAALSPKLPFLYHPGDSVNSEEDTCDLLAYLTYPDPKNLAACSILTPNEEGTAYKDLALKVENDEHSTDFMRLLREAIHKRRTLSPSCQNIVDSSGAEYRFEPCF